MEILQRYLQLINEIESSLNGLSLDDLRIFSELLARYCKRIKDRDLENFLSSLAAFAEDFGYDCNSIIRRVLRIRNAIEGYLNGQYPLERIKRMFACDVLGNSSTVSEWILSELEEYELYLKVLKIAKQNRAEYLADLPNFIEFLELEEDRAVEEKERYEVRELRKKLTKLGIKDNYCCISKYLDLIDRFEKEYKRRARELIEIEKKVMSLETI